MSGITFYYFQIAIITYKFPYVTNINRCYPTDDHYSRVSTKFGRFMLNNPT